jgi:DNA-binding XRE family transcriptional regulator
MQNLRKRRDAAGLSRWELSKIADVSPQTIADIELKGTATSVVNATRLAKALGTTVEDLMGEKVAS